MGKLLYGVKYINTHCIVCTLLLSRELYGLYNRIHKLPKLPHTSTCRQLDDDSDLHAVLLKEVYPLLKMCTYLLFLSLYLPHYQFYVCWGRGLHEPL